MADLKSISEAIIGGKQDEIKGLIEQAINDSVEPHIIINEGLLPGMNVVGKRFKNGEMFVPEVLMAAKCMHEGMALIKPLLVDNTENASSTIVLGTVKGDLHDIGKNLVGMLLASVGYNVVDVGVDVEPRVFVEKLKETGARILGLSALLTTTMMAMKDTIELLEKEGMRNSVKVIVGGAPVTQDFADEIGADGYAPDATRSIDLVERLMES